MYEVIQVEGRETLGRNRFGDSTAREVGILLPPDYTVSATSRYPVVICLAGFAATGRSLAEERHVFALPLHAALETEMVRGLLAPAIFLFPDCATRFGGSQYINSANAGDVQSFLCDTLVNHVDRTYRTIAEPAGRAVVGRSSGGYGAIRALLERPDRIGAAAALAPDCMFEHCYLPFFPAALEYWEQSGGYRRFIQSPAAIELQDHRYMLAMSLIGMASVYSPRDVPCADGALFRLPYDPRTGNFDLSVWEEWKHHDLDRLIARIPPDRLAACGPLLVTVGSMDEYNMQISGKYFCRKLEATPLRFHFSEFKGSHRGNSSILIRMIADLLARRAEALEDV